VTLRAAVDGLLARAELLSATPEAAAQLADARSRLTDPLRVALVGRVKAGKSTLLNALVGDLVAATDAAECTLIPTEYHDGVTYRAWKVYRDGHVDHAVFRRDELGARVDIGDTPVEAIERLLVEFPSPRLRDLTIIDTPGLGSANRHVSQRTADLIAGQDVAPADAVVYLLRNWHAIDREFLACFNDSLGVDVPAFNAVAVLSRADEIAGGGPDALRQATALSARWATSDVLASVVSDVLPVAGLLAQSALGLTQSEYQALVTLAACSHGERDAAFVSVARTCAPERLTALPAPTRRALVEKFGFHGLRHAVDWIGRNPFVTASDLAAELTRQSGLESLRSVLFDRFAERADVLRSMQALDVLDSLRRTHQVTDDDDLDAELERVEVNAHELAELRSIEDIVSGQFQLPKDLRRDALRVLGERGTSPAQRLGMAPDADIASHLAEELARWRSIATSSLSLPDEQRVARVVVRTLGRLRSLHR
jgi:hypothetical protein